MRLPSFYVVLMVIFLCYIDIVHSKLSAETLKIAFKEAAKFLKKVPKTQLILAGTRVAAGARGRPDVVPENVVKLTQDLMDTLPGEERALLEKYFPIRVQIGGTYFKTYDQAIWREILPDIQERLGTVFSYCVMGEDSEKELKATLKGVAVLLLAAVANDKMVHVKVCDLQESRE